MVLFDWHINVEMLHHVMGNRPIKQRISYHVLWNRPIKQRIQNKQEVVAKRKGHSNILNEEQKCCRQNQTL